MTKQEELELQAVKQKHAAIKERKELRKKYIKDRLLTLGLALLFLLLAIAWLVHT